MSIYIRIHLWVSLNVDCFTFNNQFSENIWYFLPCTWASRLSATYIVGSELIAFIFNLKSLPWGYVAIPITVVILLALVMVPNRWGGKS